MSTNIMTRQLPKTSNEENTHNKDMGVTVNVSNHAQMNDASEKPDLLQATQDVIEDALSRLGYSEEMAALLKEPLRMLEVKIPVRMDNGKVKVFTGYRCQHNDAVGPLKGGIRFHPDVTAMEMKALSIWMTLKCGIVGLPYGGGKGGVVCDPREMSARELEALSRGYVRAVSQIVGPTKDIPAPDVMTNAQIMAWMLDEYSIIHGYAAPGFITGKPLVLGGSQGRESATAQGVAIIIKLALQKKGMQMKGTKVIVQGFGNAGSFISKFMHEAGAIVVGISDARGALYNEDGLDIELLLSQRDPYGTVTHLYPDAISNKELLEKACDILIPAAIENQITEDNAARIKANIIVEAANGATTMEATRILYERGKLLVPDVLASAGGVTVSYFEWVQNNQGYYWTAEEVQERLEVVLGHAFANVYEVHETQGVNMRLAAYMVGVRDTAEAIKYRGWI